MSFCKAPRDAHKRRQTELNVSGCGWSAVETLDRNRTYINQSFLPFHPWFDCDSSTEVQSRPKGVRRLIPHPGRGRVQAAHVAVEIERAESGQGADSCSPTICHVDMSVRPTRWASGWRWTSSLPGENLQVQGRYSVTQLISSSTTKAQFLCYFSNQMWKLLLWKITDLDDWPTSEELLRFRCWGTSFDPNIIMIVTEAINKDDLI